MKRVFLIVLDSVGIGEMPDACEYGDEGSNTLKSCFKTKKLNLPNLKQMGLFNIDGIDYAEKERYPTASFARMTEKSKGKDTTIGHWEIAGIISKKPLPIYINGFPDEIIKKFEEKVKRKSICNKPYSGTKLLEDYGKHHIETGNLIIYTSADSVFQIAAHEKIVSIHDLYKYCETARKILTGKHAVGRVIARPFEGIYPNFKRTNNRRDFSLLPPKNTINDILKRNGKDVIAIGKINDIFGGRGFTKVIKTKNNQDGIEKTLEIIETNFEGLCFVNLVDFDMLYGHRNDVLGYVNALNFFDTKLYEIIKKLKPDDMLMITADHGCDPCTPSTDHSREYTPLIIFGENLPKGVNLGTQESFANISKIILNYFKLPSFSLFSFENFLVQKQAQ